jgi:hypothetical protein
MKVRLHITINAELLKEAKEYSAKNGVSLSEMIGNHFRIITGKREKQSLLDILDSMPKSKSSFSDEFDFRKEYYEEKGRNMGFRTCLQHQSSPFTIPQNL